MPRAPEYECHTRCSQVDSAYPKVKETDWNGVGDGQYNRNKEEYGSEEHIG
jgi:hypothetical protein